MLAKRLVTLQKYFWIFHKSSSLNIRKYDGAGALSFVSGFGVSMSFTAEMYIPRSDVSGRVKFEKC